MRHATCLLLAVLCLAAPGSGIAQTLAEDPVGESDTRISGFGTLGGVYNSRQDAGFIRDLSQETRPSRQYSWRPDSRLGLQISHAITPQWQVFGQVVLRDQPTIDLDSTVTRAFVSYRPNGRINLRLGRMADSTFLMSDYHEVGYAYPWARPPKESYGMIALHSYDGGDITYSLPDGDAVWRFKAMAGRLRAEVPMQIGDNYWLKSDDLWGAALIHERGPLKIRLGYSSFSLRNEHDQLPTLRNLLTSFAVPYNPYRAEALALRDLLETKGARITYSSMGFAYDEEKWVIQGEISHLDATTKLFPRGDQAYLSVGYRVGDFLPYAMVSGARSPKAVKAEHDWSQLGSPAYGQLQSATLATLNALLISQTTASLGMRWDFNSRAALKLQWDHVRVRDNGWALWDRSLSASPQGGHLNLLSATIDFVF